MIMPNWFWVAACVLLMACAPSEASSRMQQIHERGSLICGIWPYVAGFAADHDDHFEGLEIDLCHAVAAAIFGDGEKVQFVELESVAQFAERQEVDLVVRRLTWTLNRETASGVSFGPVYFHDGQGFLVPRDSGITRIADLTNERICVISMESHPRTLRNRLPNVRLVMVESDREAEVALREKRCRAYSADVSWLASARAGFADGLARYEILPDLISKEPLAPLIRAEDVELSQIVRWTIYALIDAEERGVTSRSANAANAADTANAANVANAANAANASDARTRAVIAAVGNYGEIFDRNVGAGSPIRLERGPNRLSTEGGLLYAPPLER